MRVTDGLKLWGRLRVEAYRPGEATPFKVDEERNIVVLDGRSIILGLLWDPSASPISKMELGQGGAGFDPVPTVAELYSPVPFDADDTGLRHTLGLVSTNQSPPDLDHTNKTITFTAFFNSANIVGNPYLSGIPQVTNECALLTADDQVVALRAFEPMPFSQSAAIGLRAVWTLGVNP